MITRVNRLSAPVTEVTIISLVNDMILGLNDFLPVPILTGNCVRLKFGLCHRLRHILHL